MTRDLPVMTVSTSKVILMSHFVDQKFSLYVMGIFHSAIVRDMVNTGHPILTIVLPLILVIISHSYNEKGYSCHEFCLNGMAHFGLMGYFG